MREIIAEGKGTMDGGQQMMVELSVKRSGPFKASEK